MKLYNWKLGQTFIFAFFVFEFGKLVNGFEKNCPLLQLVNGRSRYRLRGRNVRFNCMRGFQLVGVKYANCMNGKWDANVPICVKYGCRAPSTTHVNGQFIESYRGAVVRIICNPGYQLTGSPSVYCNGVRWNETFPVCRVFNNNPDLSCDFEHEDLCGWSQDPMHDFDWRRKSVFMASKEGDFGLISDHTLDSGYYMYMENYKSRMENDTARLYSPVYSPEYSIKSCFQFWYYMHGDKAGTLKVYIKPEDIELYNVIPSFWINGNQGMSWKQHAFYIEPMSTPFQVVIEGIRESGSGSNMAFDDVKIAFGNECIIAESMTTSTEFSTSVSTTEDHDDGTVPLSCKNRCNQSNVYAFENESCECNEGCFQSGDCCPDFFQLCQISVTTSTSAESESTSTSTESASSTTETRTKPSYSNPFAAKTFNNESNEIIQTKPIVQPPNIINKTADEITNYINGSEFSTREREKKQDADISLRNSTEKNITSIKLQIAGNLPPNPKLSDVNTTLTLQNTTVSRDVQTKTKSEENSTRLENTKKKIQDLKNLKDISKNRKIPSGEFNSLNVGLLPPKSEMVKNQKNGENSSEKLNFRVVSNESRFHNAVNELPGKEPPQAIKIDSQSNGKEIVPRVFEVAGICLTLLIIIALGTYCYRRSRHRKLERDNMVEDSDVRFLTSDEILDFTLARPANDDL